MSLIVHLTQSGGSGASMATVVDFYSKLPKGPAIASASSGIKARYFNGKNASGAPVLATIFGIFLMGYTIDYQSTYLLAMHNRKMS